jgi:rhodanese-related sulfurtransferase
MSARKVFSCDGGCRRAEVAEFLAEHGIEVYRMWQARPDSKPVTEETR